MTDKKIPELKPHPGPQAELFKDVVVTNPSVYSSWVSERFYGEADAMYRAFHGAETFNVDDAVAGVSHNAELIPGHVTVGHILTEEQMARQYSRLAPSDMPRWMNCPGTLTKKGNPK